MVLYGGVGMGATIYDTKVQVPTSFSTITGSGYESRKDIRDKLKSLLKDLPYVDADNNKNTTKTVFGQTLKHS